ncbi:MAG TPA: YIP1 family protein [Anaerolineae bacterium]|nr:YIP1 family protein [Anaerolineae bacterium]
MDEKRTFCASRTTEHGTRNTHHVSRFTFHASRITPGQALRFGLTLGLVLWLLVSELVPALADGPLIPGYTIRDGQRVPAPASYVQAGTITGEGQPCGPFVAPRDLHRDPATGHLLVVDTGNNRIIVLDSSGQYLYEIGGQEVELNAPEGVFVDVEGNLWVADTGNERIVQLAPAGTLLAEYHKPESDLLEEYGFKPTRIVLDKRGFIYTVVGSEGNLGIVVMDTSERFRGFFGRTRIKFNLGRVLARMFASKAQRRRMLRVRPAPMGNIHIDELGFIYAVSPVLAKDQIQRLNSVGENVYGEIGTRIGAGRLWEKLRGEEGLAFGEAETRWRWDEARQMNMPFSLGSVFVDVAVDDLGVVSALDQQRNLIYQYDQAGNLLAIFGGQGLWEGGFAQPVSIVADDKGTLYVLDAGRGDIQIFHPTEITRLIHEASGKYFDGKYEEAAVLWQEIAERDTNFALAHSGLGKALMRQERFLEAMQEYRYAENKDGYSAAFREYRYVWMRQNFNWLGLGLLVLLAGTAVAVNRLGGGFRQLLARVRDLREHGDLWAVPVLLLLAVLARMGGLVAQSFHFQAQRPEETRLVFEAGKVMIPWVTWCVSAVAVAEIFYGEGTFRQVLKSSAWALWPYILLTVPLSLMTHAITRDEKALYYVAQYLIWALVLWNFFQQIRTLHNFETGKAIGVLLLTLLGMLVIWLLVGLVYALTGEIVRFVQQIALEIYVRQY